MSHSFIAPDEAELVARVLARVPVLADEIVEDVLRLPGRDNRVFCVQLASRKVGIRVSGRRRFIDIASEYHNQAIAARAGLAPRPIGYLADAGVIVSEWLEAVPLTGAGSRPTQWPDVVRSLARLHSCSTPFADMLSPQYALRWNLTGMARHERRISCLAQSALDQCLQADRQPMVNCHGDPGLANLLQSTTSDEGLRFIDWEFSHRSTAAWDIALLCNDATLDDVESAGFVRSYNGQAAMLGATGVEQRLIDTMRGVAALASAAWLINHACSEADIGQQLEIAGHFLARYRRGSAPRDRRG